MSGDEVGAAAGQDGAPYASTRPMMPAASLSDHVRMSGAEPAVQAAVVHVPAALVCDGCTSACNAHTLESLRMPDAAPPNAHGAVATHRLTALPCPVLISDAWPLKGGALAGDKARPPRVSVSPARALLPACRPWPAAAFL
jgi:hypothetical protein